MALPHPPPPATRHLPLSTCSCCTPSSKPPTYTRPSNFAAHFSPILSGRVATTCLMAYIEISYSPHFYHCQTRQSWMWIVEKKNFFQNNTFSVGFILTLAACPFVTITRGKVSFSHVVGNHQNLQISDFDTKRLPSCRFYGHPILI